MPAGVVFEEADDSISWDKMQQVLSPQQNAHGCRRIVFEVVQRLKSRRYSTVLNTFTVRATDYEPEHTFALMLTLCFVAQAYSCHQPATFVAWSNEA